MKIGINLTDYYRGSVGGIRSYLISLVKELPIISPKDKFYVICRPSGVDDFNFPRIRHIIIPDEIKSINLSGKLLEIIREHKFDFWYSTLLVLDPLNCPIPCAFMIPDMQHETYPQFFNNDVLDWRKKTMAQSAISAEHIFTISEFSKSEIIKYLKVDSKKVSVTYISTPYWHDNPYNKTDEANTINKYKLIPNKYFFFPANMWPHKNFARLLEAFIQVKNSFPDIELVLAVQDSNVNNKIKEIITNNNIENRVKFLGFVDDKLIQYIFRNSLGVIFPSLFEGFGIPPLEAMKHHVPVACSNTTSLPEICGDAALYFNPLSVNEIAKSLTKLITNDDLRRDLIKRGNKQLQKFNYHKTAIQTLQIIKQVKKEYDKKIIIKKYPKISIITPSYNQGQFIERTIESVLNQKYPNLEYIIMDGGSTDNTINILKKYDKKIIWKSEKDRGQTHAINKGLQIATGEILGYLNSDDTYEPHTLEIIAKYFTTHPNHDFVYGLGKLIDKDDKFTENYHNSPTTFTLLYNQCDISQPSAFWTNKLYKNIGRFNEKFDYAMDYEYWIRTSIKYQLNYIKQYLSNTRIHDNAKTSIQLFNIHNNIFNIQKKYYHSISDNWIQSYSNLFIKNIDHRIWKQQVKYFIFQFLLLNFLQLKYNYHLISRRQFIEIFHQLKSLIINNPLKLKIPFLYKLYKTLFKNNLFSKYSEIGILYQHKPQELFIEKFPVSNTKSHFKISVVTPSYNQGLYINKTIESVINQNYPKTQYIVQDGKSSDNTLKVLEKYKTKIIYESIKDSGQTYAINKAFLKTDGEIMAYINSDDIYCNGAFEYVNQYFHDHPDVDVIYGNRLIINENDKQIGRWVLPPCNVNVLKYLDYVPQETMFWRRSIWNKIGGQLDESFHFAMDWDLILKFINVGANIKHVPYFLGIFRHHSQQKTSTQINTIGQQECNRLMIKYHGRVTPNDQFISLLNKYRQKSSIFSFLLDLGFKM